MKASLFKILYLLVLIYAMPCYALPGYGKPKPEQKPSEAEANNMVLIPHLRGIELNGNICCTSTSGQPICEGVTFNNLDVVGDLEALKGLLEDRFLFKPFTQANIKELKEIITQNYVSWGYPLVDVCIPPQDITDGVLQVAIIESELNEIRLTGNYWFCNDCIRQYLHLCEGYPIDMNTVTTDLYWINRNPFRRASIVFSPGDCPGTTDVNIITDEVFPLRVFGGADNRGTIPIGTNRAFAGFNWGNAFGLDHILTYQYTTSDHFKRLQAHAVAYDAYLPWQHTLSLYGGYAQVKVEHIDHFFKNKGRNYQFSARYEVPMCSYTPEMCHGFGFGFDYKRTNNNLTFSDDPVFSNQVDLTQLVFGYWYEACAEWGEFWLAGDIVASPFRFLRHQSVEDYESLRLFAKPRYIYLKGEIENTYYLPWCTAFVTRVQAQWTNENLLPSEEFWLGGFDTIRGYNERVIDGDSGVILNLELYSPPLSPITWFDLECFRACDFCEILEFLLFFDYGTTSASHRFVGQPKFWYLMSAGPGLRYWVDDYLEVRADWGFQLHRWKEHKGKSNRLNFSVLVAF